MSEVSRDKVKKIRAEIMKALSNLSSERPDNPRE